MMVMRVLSVLRTQGCRKWGGGAGGIAVLLPLLQCQYKCYLLGCLVNVHFTICFNRFQSEEEISRPPPQQHPQVLFLPQNLN